MDAAFPCMVPFRCRPVAGSIISADTGLAGDAGLKALRQSTGGALSVFEASIGVGPPLHVHEGEDECFYVLDGERHGIRVVPRMSLPPIGELVFPGW